jgi:hypothetical protein
MNDMSGTWPGVDRRANGGSAFHEMKNSKHGRGNGKVHSHAADISLDNASTCQSGCNPLGKETQKTSDPEVAGADGAPSEEDIVVNPGDRQLPDDEH